MEWTVVDLYCPCSVRGKLIPNVVYTCTCGRQYRLLTEDEKKAIKEKAKEGSTIK